MAKLKPILIISLTLLTGFMLGVFSTRYYVSYRMDRMAGQNLRQVFKDRFLRGLDITPEQMEQLEPILNEHFNEMAAARQQLAQSVQKLRRQIAPILTAEQRQILEERRRNEERRGRGPNRPMRRRRGPGGPPPEAPPGE